MAYKFCDHKVTGEGHLVSSSVHMTHCSDSSFVRISGGEDFVTELLDMNFRLKLL